MKDFLLNLRRQLLRATGHHATMTRLEEVALRLDALASSIDGLRRDIRALPRSLSSSSPRRGRALPAGRQTLRSEPQTAAEAGGGPMVERLAFLLQTEELLNHYGCIWELLPAGTADVITYGELEANPPPRLAAFPHRVVSATELLDTGTRYRYLVSNHPIKLSPPLLPMLAARNIRLMYAAGKSGWNLSEWNTLYDLILCFGPYHADALAEVSDALIVQMGYPRFDRYFTSRPQRDALCATYGCDPARKTVVWLPTWKTLSSVGLFDAEISALTQRYNVVVKLHPLMSEQEPERVAALSQHRFTRMLTDASDNLPLYQLADWMLFDYGGPALAGVYVDKPMLLLNVPGAEDDALTGADSPDIVIRDSLPSVSPRQEAIGPLLADDAFWTRQGDARRALRRSFFAPYLGFSSQVAAQTLLHLDRLLPSP